MVPLLCHHLPLSYCDVVLLLQLVLQEVAWDEASRERKRAERAAIVTQYQDIGDLQHEPLFCAETALKVVHARVCGCLAAQPACADRYVASETYATHIAARVAFAHGTTNLSQHN